MRGAIEAGYTRGQGAIEVWVHKNDKKPEGRMLTGEQINCALREGKMGNEYGCDIMPQQRGLIDAKIYTS